MLNLILKMTQEVYFHWCWTDNKYGYKLLKMFLPKEGHEGDGEGVRQLEAREQISPDWRSRHGVAHRRGGWRTTVTASLGAGGVDTRTSGLGDRHCWNTAAWQGPAGGGAGSGGSTIRALSGLGHEIGDSPQAPGGAEAGREKSRPPSDGGLAWENLLSLLGRLAIFLQYGKKITGHPFWGCKYLKFYFF